MIKKKTTKSKKKNIVLNNFLLEVPPQHPGDPPIKIITSYDTERIGESIYFNNYSSSISELTNLSKKTKQDLMQAFAEEKEVFIDVSAHTCGYDDIMVI